jgi:MFS family permease
LFRPDQRVVSDSQYSAKPVFVFGFGTLAVLNLIISFLPDMYSFFVIRAISGVAGATLIPAAFRLIVAVFEPEELSKAFTLFGMSGVLANSTGIIIAGIFEFIPTHGQGAPWRWFFRMIFIVITPVAIASYWWIPNPTGEAADVKNKFKRLDIPGAFLMLAAIILLILGLTLGASYGFTTAGFFAPFFISLLLFPAFFVWESRIPEEFALLPPKVWRIPNFTLLIMLALYIYAWWAVNFLPFIEIWVRGHQELPIIAAVRVLPQSISAAFVTLLLTFLPKLVNKPRWPISIGLIVGIVGYVLFSQSGTQVGNDYWRFLFPGFVIGSAGTMAVFTGTNVGIMTSVPPEMAGVAGAILQVALQVGSAVAFSIQAGLLTIYPGGIENFVNVRISFYFMVGWGVLTLIGFLAFYRQPKANPNDEERIVVAH